jgi:hypothetical protein
MACITTAATIATTVTATAGLRGSLLYKRAQEVSNAHIQVLTHHLAMHAEEASARPMMLLMRAKKVCVYHNHYSFDNCTARTCTSVQSVALNHSQGAASVSINIMASLYSRYCGKDVDVKAASLLVYARRHYSNANCTHFAYMNCPPFCCILSAGGCIQQGSASDFVMSSRSKCHSSHSRLGLRAYRALLVSESTKATHK